MATPANAPTSLTQALTEMIRELLHTEGWSQREFAERLGVTQGAVSYLLAEKRRVTALDYYERLARIFGVSLSELIATVESRLHPHSVTQTRPPGRARHHATPTTIRNLTPLSRAYEENEVLWAVVQALVAYDARRNASEAQIEKRAAHAAAQLAKPQKHAAHKNPRRRKTKTKRAHRQAAARRDVQADPEADQALSAGRGGGAGDLRKTG